MALSKKGLSGFVDLIFGALAKKPKGFGDAIGRAILFEEIIKPIVDGLAKQIDAEALALAQREWKKIVLKLRVKPDKSQVITVATAMDIVDAILAEHDGAAAWLPAKITNEMSRQFYHELRQNALPKKGHSTRGRWIIGRPGRPKKGEQIGQVVWHRQRGAR